MAHAIAAFGRAFLSVAVAVRILYMPSRAATVAQSAVDSAEVDLRAVDLRAVDLAARTML